MAVGCALPPFSSLWWFGFCLGPCAFNYREEDGNIRTPGWAVPPGVACVGHVPALRVGFCIHQAAHLDTLAFAAPVPDVQPWPEGLILAQTLTLLGLLRCGQVGPGGRVGAGGQGTVEADRPLAGALALAASRLHSHRSAIAMSEGTGIVLPARWAR